MPYDKNLEELKKEKKKIKQELVESKRRLSVLKDTTKEEQLVYYIDRLEQAIVKNENVVKRTMQYYEEMGRDMDVLPARLRNENKALEFYKKENEWLRGELQEQKQRLETFDVEKQKQDIKDLENKIKVLEKEKKQKKKEIKNMEKEVNKKEKTKDVDSEKILAGRRNSVSSIDSDRTLVEDGSSISSVNSDRTLIENKVGFFSKIKNNLKDAKNSIQESNDIMNEIQSVNTNNLNKSESISKESTKEMNKFNITK